MREYINIMNVIHYMRRHTMSDKQEFKLTKEQYEKAMAAIEYEQKTKERSKRLSQRRNAKLMIVYKIATEQFNVPEPTESEIDQYIKDNKK